MIIEKKCRGCRETKTLLEFDAELATLCAPCAKSYRDCPLKRKITSAARERRKKNLLRYQSENWDKVYAKEHEWRKDNRERANATAKKLYQKHQLSRTAYHRTRNLRTKLAAFDAYGGRLCNCCGETAIDMLTLDHLNNDGAAHRKVMRGGGRSYIWAERNDYPPIFQVLCFNCNSSRHVNGGTICSHEIQRLRLIA